MIKGLVAGFFNVVFALAHGDRLPGLPMLAAAGALGCIGYGASLVLFVHGLRHLGAARTGAYFSTAPFIGALLAIGMLGETISPALIGAATLMGIGVYLHLTETHCTSMRMTRLSTNIGTPTMSIISIIINRTIRAASRTAIFIGTRP